MMKDVVFKSKIGYGILSFIILVIGGSIAIAIINREWVTLLVLAPVVAFIVHLYATTYYSITGDYNLIIKSGFYKVKVPINNIKRIVATKNPLSAPALSIDRLEVFYDRFDSVLVSPKEKQEFIDALKSINPAILS